MSTPPPELLHTFQLEISHPAQGANYYLDEMKPDTTSSPSPADLGDRIRTNLSSSPSRTKTSSASAVDVAAMSTDLTSKLSDAQAAMSENTMSEKTMSAKPIPMAELILKVVAFVKEYMAQYDGSHDFNHIKRVLGLAHVLRLQSPGIYDIDIVTLAALLHDVGDRKYLKAGQDGKTMVSDVLKDMGATEELAVKIQSIVNCVSYSAEIKEGGKKKIKECLEKYGRELECVQDADRLDAIGAVGVGRCFAFGGMKGRGLQDSIDHFSDKLEKLQEMMKTELGRNMAQERTATIAKMRKAWESENKEAMAGLEALAGLNLSDE